MKFSDIPGHEEVKERLRSMADSDKLPHALLLEGPPGIGKYALARAFAQYLHCPNHTNGDSCGVCATCRQHQNFNNVDTIYTFPVVNIDNHKRSDDFLAEFQSFITESPLMDIENWLGRLNKENPQPKVYVEEANELLRKFQYTATNAKYRIVLFWLPERMNEDTANKLLKLIEEPYPDTLFILTSDNSKLILPTIYSRCQRIRVKPYTADEIVNHLQTHYSVDIANANHIARLAQGNLNEAIKLLGVSKMRKKFLDLFMELMRKAYLRNVGDLKKWANTVSDFGRETEMQFLDYCARLIRENFILNIRVDELNALSLDELQFSQKFSPFINNRNVLKLVDVIDKAKIDVAANGYQKLINFDLAIKVILLLKQ